VKNEGNIKQTVNAIVKELRERGIYA